MNKNKNIIEKKQEYYKNNELEIIIFDHTKLEKKNKTIISLTSTPNRFLSTNFDKIINDLLSQTMRPDVIVINLCAEYKRKFIYDEYLFFKKIDKLKTNDKIVINICKTDYGPITKILGLIELDDTFEEDDLIIVVDDDIEYNKNIIFLYNLNHLIYNSDIIGISQKNHLRKNITTDIFSPIYSGKTVFGWMSWGIKYKFLRPLYDYYVDYINIDEDLWKHDDLFINMFYHDYKLSSSEIGINSVVSVDNNDKIASLRSDNNISGDYRQRLEKKFKYKTVKKIEIDIINTNINNIDLYFYNNIVKFIKN